MEASALLSAAPGAGGIILSHSLNFPAVLYPNAPPLGLVDVNYNPLRMAHYEGLGGATATGPAALSPSGLYTIRRGAHPQPLPMPILPQLCVGVAPGRIAPLAFLPASVSNASTAAPYLVSASSDTGATTTAAAAFSMSAAGLNSDADDAVKSSYYSVSYV